MSFSMVFILMLGIMVLIAGLLVVSVCVRFLMSDKRSGPGSPREEAELMQELHRTAERLEERLDTLETLILEERGAQQTR